MNLHEYQGKEMLSSFGVRIQRGMVAENHIKAVEVAKQIAAETGTGWWVIKAQIHAGGRGKGGGGEKKERKCETRGGKKKRSRKKAGCREKAGCKEEIDG